MPEWRDGKPAAKRPSVSDEAPIQTLRYVIVDTELTSLDHRTNRLLSIGAIAMQGPSIRLGEQFYRVVNPGVSIPAETVLIHKLRAEDVGRGEELQPVLDDLNQFLGEAIVVGHFVAIDLKALEKEMLALGRRLDNWAIDTAKVYHWLLKRGPYSEDLHLKLDKMDLASLASSYQLEIDHEHHALADAFLAARIWQKMLYELKENGVESLRKLLKIGAP